MKLKINSIVNYLKHINSEMQPNPGPPPSNTQPMYLYTSCFTSNQSQFSHLLYLIRTHPSFIAKVNSFVLLFNGELTS